MEKIFKKLELKYHFMWLVIIMLFGLFLPIYSHFDREISEYVDIYIDDLHIKYGYYIALALIAFIWLILIIKPNIKLHFLKDLFILATIINVLCYIWYFPWNGHRVSNYISIGTIITFLAILWNLFIYNFVIVKKAVTFDEYGKKEE